MLTGALRRTVAVAWIESLQILRDRTSLSLILLVPAVQILLFGYAIQLEPTAARVALAGPGTERGGRIEQLVSSAPRLEVIARGLASGSAEAMLRRGEAVLAVESPPQPPPEACENPRPVRVLADGADPTAAAPALAALQTRTLQSAARTGAAPAVTVEWLFNPDRRAAWVLAPGLIGVVVMISMLMLGAQTLVREREAGSWEALLATPVTALDALVGKLSPYVGIAFFQAGLVLILARVLFHLPMQGAWAALLASVPLFAVAHLVLGFGLSALARTRLQAIQGAVFFYLPSILLSGFLFPFSAMPAWARALSEALPLTHFVRAARGALLRGTDAASVWREMGAVAVFTLAACGIALAAYRRRLT